MIRRDSSAVWTDSADELAETPPDREAVPSPPASSAWAPVAHEADLLRVLDSSVPGESIAAQYDRRELELVALFSVLPSPECLELHRRLVSACPEDPVVIRFGRMIEPRRNRLLAFLADARRREKLSERQRSRRAQP